MKATEITLLWYCLYWFTSSRWLLSLHEIFVLVNKLQVKTYVKTKQLRMDLSHPLPLRLVVL